MWFEVLVIAFTVFVDQLPQLVDIFCFLGRLEGGRCSSFLLSSQSVNKDVGRDNIIIIILQVIASESIRILQMTASEIID